MLLIQVGGITYFYRSSFLQSPPDRQVKIVDYLMVYLQSKAYGKCTLKGNDKIKLVKELMDVVALRLEFRSRLV